MMETLIKAFDAKLSEMREELEQKLPKERIRWLCENCIAPFMYEDAGLFELRWLLEEAEIRKGDWIK
jgi:hypothetical protein